MRSAATSVFLFAVAAGLVTLLAGLRKADEPTPDPTPVAVAPQIAPAEPEPPQEEPEPEVLPDPPEGLTATQERVWRRLQHHGREDEYECLAEIYMAESSWRPDVVGDLDRGGSHGLPQRHAPSHGAPPSPWPVEDQVDWSLDYADERYGGVCEAAEERRRKGWW